MTEPWHPPPLRGLGIESVNLDQTLRVSPAESLELPPSESYFTFTSEDSKDSSVEYLPPPVHPAPRVAGTTNVDQLMLQHLLDSLEARPKPPSIADALKPVIRRKADSKLAAAVETVVGSILSQQKSAQRNQSSSPNPPSNSDASRATFSTDGTVALLSELITTLAKYIAKGGNLVTVGETQGPSELESVESLQWLPPVPSFDSFASEEGSRAPSPDEDDDETHQDIMLRCIDLLSSILLEDCRFQTSSPTPFNPPNALQALTLQFARVLLMAIRGDLELQSKVSFTMLAAFTNFRPEMRPKLLGFLNEGTIRSSVEELRELRRRFLFDDVVYVAVASEEGHASIPSARGEADVSEDEDIGGLAGIPTANHHAIPHEIRKRNEVFPALLSAILENIPVLTPPSEVPLQLRQALKFMVEMKEDSNMDLISVVAYSLPSSVSRRPALSILAAQWPRAMGHTFETLPLPTPAALVSSSEASRDAQHNANPHPHQFIPWCFLPNPVQDTLGIPPRGTCAMCTKPITEFGLTCTGCLTACHMDCYDYPSGNALTQYFTTQNSSTQRIAVFRYCDVSLPVNAPESDVIHVHQHVFVPVNLFTLTLCLCCQEPLWGTIMQAHRCLLCSRFIHKSCILASLQSRHPCQPNELNASAVTIAWDALVRSFTKHHRDMLWTGTDFDDKSHPEVSILQTYLWTQEKIFEYGLAMGSLVVSGRRGKFELQTVLEACKRHMTSKEPSAHPTLYTYFQTVKQLPGPHAFVYDLPLLAYIAGHLKRSLEGEVEFSNSGSLHETSSKWFSDLPGDMEDELSIIQKAGTSFEVVSQHHLMRVLHRELNVFQWNCQRIILDHLVITGFIERVDRSSTFYNDDDRLDHVYFRFPLPLMHDKTFYEAAIWLAGVEKNLASIDLSINEMGFLALVRLFMPNAMTPEDMQELGARAILKWIINEEPTLTIVLRDYVTKSRPVPGLRPPSAMQPWPISQSSRGPAGNARGSGNDYASCRRALFARYAMPWMGALCEANADTYGTIIWELCRLLPQDADSWITKSQTFVSEKERALALADDILRCIGKLAQTSVLFNHVDVVIAHWFCYVTDANLCNERIPMLSKVFAKDADLNSRATSVVIGTPGFKAALEPWTILKRLATSTSSDLRVSKEWISWLAMIARSGADVPNSAYSHFFPCMDSSSVSVVEANFFVEALMHSAYLRSLGRQELLAPLVLLQTRLLNKILPNLYDEGVTDQDVPYVRRCLAACLLLYGCEREELLAIGILDDNVEANSRRNVAIRAAPMTKPLHLDPGLPFLLTSYLSIGNEKICYFVAHFLKLCTSDCPLVDDAEIWLREHSTVLCQCLWTLYGLQKPNIDGVRGTLLSRILVASPGNFKALLDDQVSPNCPVHVRLAAMHKVFQMVLDSIEWTANDEQNQFRSYLFDLYKLFFSAVWVSGDEEIRQAVDVWTMGLLPGQLEGLTACWSEMIPKAAIKERLEMLTFLSKLCYRFKNWQAITWPTIRSLLDESRFEEAYNPDFKGALTGETAEQEAATLVLGMRMLPAGEYIDLANCKVLKNTLAKTLGFRTLAPTFQDLESVPSHALPCILGLVELLDASRPLALTTSMMGQVHPDGNIVGEHLVGSYFVDIHLALFNQINDLLSIPVTYLKRILDGLIIVVYKHTLSSPPLAHLQGPFAHAMTRSMLLLSSGITIETQQLIVSLYHAYLLHSSPLQVHIVGLILVTLIEIIIDYEHPKDDAFINTARKVAYLALKRTAQNGVFITFSKEIPRPREYFIAMRDILHDDDKENTTGEDLATIILRDTIRRLKARPFDEVTTQNILTSLQEYFKNVYSRRCDPDMIPLICSCLADIVRKNKDWVNLDVSPMVEILASLIENNRIHGQALVATFEAVLRATVPKLPIGAPALTRIIEATAGLSVPAVPGVKQAQNLGTYVVILILEIFFDALNLTNGFAIPHKSVRSFLLACQPYISNQVPRRIASLIHNGINYIQSPAWIADPRIRADLTTSLLVAEHVVAKAKDHSNLLRAWLVAENNASWGLRWWNVLILCVIKDGEADAIDNVLWDQWTEIAASYDKLLQKLLYGPDEPPASDINHAYIAIKLWLLLAKRAKGHKPKTRLLNSKVYSSWVWHEFWLSFVHLSEVVDSNGRPSPTALMVQASMGDIALFVKQLRDCHANEVLWYKYRDRATQPSTKAKFDRADRWDPSEPLAYPLTHFTKQIWTDINTAEKLYLSEELMRTRQI